MLPVMIREQVRGRMAMKMSGMGTRVRSLRRHSGESAVRAAAGLSMLLLTVAVQLLIS